MSNRLLCQTHAILLRSARGEKKNPGEVRRSQNWIGGSGPMDAAFVPPHQDEVPDHMADLEKFLHNEDIAVPELVRVAIAHYQFETIHPFNDGNGRIGRLLITLFLVSKGLLAKPSLYLSDFFERNRSSYIDNLMRARTSNELGQWVRFFLSGVLEVASKGRDTFKEVLALRQEAETQCHGLGKRAASALAVLNVLFVHGVVSAKLVQSETRLTQPTVDAVLQEFLRLGLLREMTGQQRNRLFAFHSYLTLFVK